MFDTKYLNRYRNQKNIKEYLEKLHLKLVNKNEIEDFINWKPFDLKSYSVSKKSKETQKIQNKYKKKTYTLFLIHLTNIICREKIGISYGANSIKKSISNESESDVLFLVKDDYDDDIENKILDTYDDNDEESIAQYKVDCIKGFIIVEKGGCEDMPESYVLKLICTVPEVKSNVLMGAYLYMIKIIPSISKVGLLELSDGYNNISGFCTYTKFGFQADLSFFNDYCFTDKTNLPMTVNLNSGFCFTKSGIIRAVVNNTPLCPLNRNDQELCTTYAPKKNKYVDRSTQKKMLKLYNDMYRQSVSRKSKKNSHSIRTMIQLSNLKEEVKRRKSMSKTRKSKSKSKSKSNSR